MRPSQRPPFTEAEIAKKWPEHARRIRFHIDKSIVLHVTPEDAEAWRMALQLAESAIAPEPAWVCPEPDCGNPDCSESHEPDSEADVCPFCGSRNVRYFKADCGVEGRCRSCEIKWEHEG